MTPENLTIAAIAVIALKAVTEMIQIVKGLVDRRNGRGEGGGHAILEHRAVIEHRLRAIEDTLRTIGESLHEIRDKMLTPIVTHLAVVEHRLGQLEERPR